MRAPLAAALLVVLAGCAAPPEAPSPIPYPRLGDVAEYEVTGAYLEVARWENGHPVAPGTRVRMEVTEGGKVIDGARHVHDTYRVLVSVGGARHAEHHVAPQMHARVQSLYPLSQDQSIVAFDERSLPWLFGASSLFGTLPTRDAEVPLRLDDNLGAGNVPALAWIANGTEDLDGVASARFRLAGAEATLRGEVWTDPASAWPLRVRLEVLDAALAPQVRVDAAYPATMDARRVALQPGSEPLPPRHSGAAFLPDDAAKVAAWDGEKPPDGDAGYVPYLLAEAVRDAKLLDKPLADWLAAAEDPRLYRATHKLVPVNATPPLDTTRAPYWLLVFVERQGRYYQVEVERVDVPTPLPTGATGVPRVVSSRSVAAPADPNHGWFPREALPADLVPLSEGVRIVREVFGAEAIEIFLRSFARPPGYAYFIDGGFEEDESGRYTVVYNPATRFMEEATGPVTVRTSA